MADQSELFRYSREPLSLQGEIQLWEWDEGLEQVNKAVSFLNLNNHIRHANYYYSTGYPDQVVRYLILCRFPLLLSMLGRYMTDTVLCPVLGAAVSAARRRPSGGLPARPREGAGRDRRPGRPHGESTTRAGRLGSAIAAEMEPALGNKIM